ncbi:hypothetical protein CAEBREN_22295 [Caenorhabditis brenneri]|uniref:Uncharacterized protein n=1 Tax=Caenorhabditis brenneri TaxID=135651 RepID=G0MLP2_CAEBE|nr:hypothetical protein CAEBREN_22295 [Caenorhabditis brenneri]
MDRFSEYMKSRPGVFKVATQNTKIKCISTKKTNLLRVYDPDDIDAYVHPDDGEKFDLGSREKYWNETIKSRKLAVKQDLIV